MNNRPNFRIFNSDFHGPSPGLLREFSELLEKVNSLEEYIRFNSQPSTQGENEVRTPYPYSTGETPYPFGDTPSGDTPYPLENLKISDEKTKPKDASKSAIPPLSPQTVEDVRSDTSPLQNVEVVSTSSDPKNKTLGYCSSASGFGNFALAFASKAEGKGAKARLRTQQSYASGSFAIPGDAQYTRIILKGKTQNTKTRLRIDDVGDYIFFGSTSNTLLKITTFGSSEQGAFFYAKHKFITFVNPTTITLVEISKDKKDSGPGWNIEIFIENRVLIIEVSTTTQEVVKWLSMAESLETHHIINLLE